jgi:hypothetical protein
MSNMYKDLKHIKMYVEKKNTQANKLKHNKQTNNKA